MTRGDKINKFLTEKVMGECWHTRINEPVYESYGTWLVVCEKCGKSLCLTRSDENLNPDFFKNTDFLKNPVDWHRLLMIAMEKEWWFELIKDVKCRNNEVTAYNALMRLLNPLPVLGTEIYNFLNKRVLAKEALDEMTKLKEEGLEKEFVEFMNLNNSLWTLHLVTDPEYMLRMVKEFKKGGSHDGKF